MKITSLVAVAALLASWDAGAQMTRQRDRMGSPREATRERPEARQPSPAADPIAALERELPSLKVDLRLTAEQVAAWSAFERDVHDIAEMERARRKRAMALKGAEESHRTAMTVVAAIAEDDRLKAETSVELKQHLQALYDLLDAPQRQLLDNRVVMSQTEPLGAVPPR